MYGAVRKFFRAFENTLSSKLTHSARTTAQIFKRSNISNNTKASKRKHTLKSMGTSTLDSLHDRFEPRLLFELSPSALSFLAGVLHLFPPVSAGFLRLTQVCCLFFPWGQVVSLEVDSLKPSLKVNSSNVKPEATDYNLPKQTRHRVHGWDIGIVTMT